MSKLQGMEQAVAWDAAVRYGGIGAASLAGLAFGEQLGSGQAFQNLANFNGNAVSETPEGVKWWWLHKADTTLVFRQNTWSNGIFQFMAALNNYAAGDLEANAPMTMHGRYENSISDTPAPYVVVARQEKDHWRRGQESGELLLNSGGPSLNRIYDEAFYYPGISNSLGAAQMRPLKFNDWKSDKDSRYKNLYQ